MLKNSSLELGIIKFIDTYALIGKRNISYKILIFLSCGTIKLVLITKFSCKNVSSKNDIYEISVLGSFKASRKTRILLTSKMKM